MARFLGERLDLPVHHLRRVLWTPGWVALPEPEFLAVHAGLLAGEKWVIDGVAYTASIESRFAAAEAIIFLDLPLALCRERAAKRMAEQLLEPNPFVTEGCVYQEVPDRLYAALDYFHHETRPWVLELLGRAGPAKHILHITDPSIQPDEVIAMLRGND